jgi:hypothetical protein
MIGGGPGLTPLKWSWFAIGAIFGPIFGIIVGAEWTTVLLLIPVGGAFGVALGARGAYFRHAFGPDKDQEPSQAPVDSAGQSLLRLVTFEILAGVIVGIAAALILDGDRGTYAAFAVAVACVLAPVLWLVRREK